MNSSIDTLSAAETGQALSGLLLAVLTIISKMLAAAGWGLVTIYVAAKLWRNYQHTKKQK